MNKIRYTRRRTFPASSALRGGDMQSVSHVRPVCCILPDGAMTTAQRHVVCCILPVCFILLVGPFLLTGCDVFSTRDPSPPLEDAGTYVQPDTPDQVIENIQNAVIELNAQNYRRSFADGFEFRPTASAEAGNPSIWTGWGVQDEESYFRATVQAARLTSGNELRLNETNLSAIDAQRFTFDAGYVLTINHRRPDLATSLQGRLVWTLEQGEDGLWRITEWTDREVGDAESWSDLKAEFIK